MFSKNKNRQQTKACVVKNKSIKDLSVYFRQNANLSNFSGSDSWVVLSQIEKQIKEKIEKIGTPLKDWEIQINYGIKTGLNEAFIITGDKRQELINLDPKSEEIIRPLLRGRDIKRYAYEFAELFIITTFPSLKIDIEKYPAVKQHLIRFGYDRLKQTGDKGSRKKTNNKWFETQDSISYWDDFSKQKIVWKIIGNQMAFFIDTNKFIVNNACYILTGSSLPYLLAVLNSKIIKWYSFLTNMNKTGVGDVQVGGQNIILFPIPLLSDLQQIPFNKLVEEISNRQRKKDDTSDIEHKIEKLVYQLYCLKEEEIDFIESL
jgi:hypothetical protein